MQKEGGFVTFTIGREIQTAKIAKASERSEHTTLKSYQELYFKSQTDCHLALNYRSQSHKSVYLCHFSSYNNNKQYHLQRSKVQIYKFSLF